jgi:RNA ligase
MFLDELFTEDDFKQHIADGYVRVRNHPTLPLHTVGYTEKAQFDRVWDDVTTRCRGLIYDDTGLVLARPFDKFHNWDDSGQPYPPGGECYLSPKMDGSLGILYQAQEPGRDQAWYVATRGSFESDQAKWATGKLWSMFMDGEVDHHDLNPAFTYLVEIIYPANRIVVDYGQDEKLVLLDVIDTETGRSALFEFHNITWPHKVEKKLIRGFHDGLVHEIPSGEEGFVIYWPHRNYRVKMKSAEYVALHRIVTGLNARTVWSEMGLGKTAQQICDNIPDEFHDWVKDVADQLEARRNVILNKVVRVGVGAVEMVPEHDRNGREFRKDFAKNIGNHEYKGYVFAWLDKKDLFSLIWKDLRPEAGWEPRSTQGEAV